MVSNFTRRDFLKTASAATLSALAAREPRLWAAEIAHSNPSSDANSLTIEHPKAHRRHLHPALDGRRHGGARKRSTPSATPLRGRRARPEILCTFPAIDTAVDNIKISQGLENVAKVMDRGTLIRSHVVADLGNILHSRHQYHWHTGYVPPQTVACPHIGSWIAQVLRAEQPGHPGLHQHRPAARRRRRDRRS